MPRSRKTVAEEEGFANACPHGGGDDGEQRHVWLAGSRGGASSGLGSSEAQSVRVRWSSLQLVGRVENWRGGLGYGLLLLQGFPVCGAISVCHAPFPVPARRTGRADFRHPALGQGITLRPTNSSNTEKLFAVARNATCDS